MIQRSRTVSTAQNGAELGAHGTGLLPVAAYDNDYTEREAAWHWHRELEFVLVQEGAIQYQAGDRVVSLKKGDCAMINSGVIHHGGMHNAGEKWCRFINFLFLPELVAPGNSAIYRKYV